MRGLTARLPLFALCASLALSASPAARQTARPRLPAAPRTPSPASRLPAQQPAPDGIGLLLQKIEQAIRSGDAAGYEELLVAGGSVAAAKFTASMMRPGITRVVVRERDRAPLGGVGASRGYRLAVDVFCEYGRRARLSTWSVDVIRKGPAAGGDGTTDEWAIRAYDAITSFTALYNLALGPREFGAKNLVLTAEDFELRLPDGGVFVAETDEGPTVLVLVGRGQIVFRPRPFAEREQVRIFAGSDTVDTGFSAAFVRVSPAALQSHIARGTMIERPVNPADAKLAAEVFRADSGKSFGVSMGDLSAEAWSLVPGTADFLAEVHTKRFGVLTYSRSAHEAEDINLFDRAKRRNISLYASPQRLVQRGVFYDDDDDRDYEVLDHDIEASLDPPRQMISGIGRITIKVRAPSVTTLTFKLNESLAVDSVVSREFGRVVSMRVVNQNTFLVNLPKSVSKGTILAFTVVYHGRIAAQFIDREAVSVASRQQLYEETDEPVPVEPSYLYSNRNYWYPQGETNGYATATLRIRVPGGYACVASGDPDPATADAMAKSASDTQFVFRALQPVRYLSVLVTRLLPVRSQVVAGADAPDRDGVPRSGVFYPNVELRSFASPRMRGRASPLADRAGDILRFYASLVGDCPYPTLTLALVERELPGGHSPAYLAVVSQPILQTPYDWRGDPTSFPQFPEFFLAHEIAHQWWGQAVGWKNYHEQWLSEGLAQYFAALYAERIRGKDVFDDIVRRMQSWAVKKSAEGPVYLGYRIGHVKRDPQLFRAVVYNKSAVVLHMLRRLVGDEAFFRGLRRFYQDWRFRNAGTDDLRRAFEAESHRSLLRFFEQWIYDSRLPRVKFSSRTERDAATGRSVIVLRFEQTGDIFDLPVTVTLDYAGRPPVDVVVPVTEAVTETRVPLEGTLRSVGVNRDQAAVAKIDK